MEAALQPLTGPACVLLSRSRWLAGQQRRGARAASTVEPQGPPAEPRSRGGAHSTRYLQPQAAGPRGRVSCRCSDTWPPARWLETAQVCLSVFQTGVRRGLWADMEVWAECVPRGLPGNPRPPPASGFLRSLARPLPLPSGLVRFLVSHRSDAHPSSILCLPLPSSKDPVTMWGPPG